MSSYVNIIWEPIETVGNHEPTIELAFGLTLAGLNLSLGRVILTAHEELSKVMKLMSLQGLGEEVRNVVTGANMSHGEDALLDVVTNAKPSYFEML